MSDSTEETSAKTAQPATDAPTATTIPTPDINASITALNEQIQKQISEIKNSINTIQKEEVLQALNDLALEQSLEKSLSTLYNIFSKLKYDKGSLTAANKIITSLLSSLNAIEKTPSLLVENGSDTITSTIKTLTDNQPKINKLLNTFEQKQLKKQLTDSSQEAVPVEKKEDKNEEDKNEEDKNEGDKNEGDKKTTLSTDQPCPKDKEDPISLIFNLLYFIGGIIASVLVVIIFVLATFDLLKFNITAISQYISLLNNPNMYNKDTQDFEALMYYRNSTDTEPYTIFGQQEIVKVIFTLGTSVVGVIMLQVFILLFLLIVYKFIKDKPLDIGNIDFKQNVKPLGTILIVVILAFVWSGLYKARFVNSIQPSIIYTHNNIEQVKNYIYINLTTNEAFLSNLINGDLNECRNIINQQTNDSRIVRMIYTMSVYNFFKINISENEEAFNTVIRSIFTLPEIRVRSVNPIHYMYYNQNVFLPNLYPILRQYIYGSNNAIRTSAQDKKIRLDITQRINETNKRLMTLFKVPERKSQLQNYFYITFAVSLLFLFIIYALYREDISRLLGGDLITKLKEIIAMVLGSKSAEAAAPAKTV